MQHTTDVGQNQCYNSHGGTSAAAPLAAGIFALALGVRPDLTWRDMQYLAMMTAVPINLDSGDWQNTTIGKKYSHTFGYGKIDTYGLVEAAKTWKSVKPQAWYFSPWIHVKQAIPSGRAGTSRRLRCDGGHVEGSQPGSSRTRHRHHERCSHAPRRSQRRPHQPQQGREPNRRYPAAGYRARRIRRLDVYECGALVRIIIPLIFCRVLRNMLTTLQG